MYRYIIILLFIAIPFLPTFEATDIVGAHWFYLGILNTASILYLTISNQFNFSFNFSSKLLLSYFGFILTCFISLTYSDFLNYSIQDLSRILSVFLSFLIVSSIIRSFDFPFLFVAKVFVTLLFFELVITFLPYLIYLYNNFSILIIPLPEPEPNAFKGISANVNISSASIISKIPFVLYFLYYSLNFKKLFYAILMFFSIIAIFILGSRAAFISLFVQILLFICFLVLSKKRLKEKFINIIIISFVFLSSIFINDNIFYNSNSVSKNISTIQISNESSSNRFELWSHAIDFSLSHPFGTGLGNWKIKSAPYWKFHGDDYSIPYHAHNDFLELLTEIGFIGASLYLFIFIFMSISLLKSIFINRNINDIFFLMILCNYLLDSLLNFPLERYVTQLIFIFILSYSYNIKFKNIE